MNGFELVSPESVGISSEAILQFLEEAKLLGVEMHSFMLLRYGKVCARGWWRPYAPELPQSMFSFSKSLTATAVGFAEQEGLLSLDEKLTDIFPEQAAGHADENLQEADIYSLLTMSCGQEKELLQEEQEKADWIERFFTQRFVYRPGSMFQYNTAGSNLLAAVIEKKTGQPLTSYLRPRLFEPLGMTDVYCHALPDGTQQGGAGFCLKTEDMARFMQFYLQRGVWNGKRLLNEAWFDRAAEKQIETVNPIFLNSDSNWQHGYGFQFWRCIPADVYRADGAYGQFGVVMPKKQAVLIITSASADGDRLLQLVWQILLENMQEAALPTCAAREKQLRDYCAGLELPALWGARDRAAERQFSGQRYRPEQFLPGLTDYIGGAGIRKKDGGQIEELTFLFEDRAARLLCEQEGENITLTIPTDGRWLTQTIGGHSYAATGRWQGKNHFLFEVRCLQAVSGALVHAVFSEDSLTLHRETTLPNEEIKKEICQYSSIICRPV